ncbi:MAG: hypothetical protein WC292_00060 [Clostridia bacterium]
MSTTRNSTNLDWWSNLGVVRSKAVITLADSTVIEVYGTDYIQKWKVTQNISSDKDRPVFDFVSDKLEMTLYSLDNDFNPFAESSQYYGKFILGAKIDLFVKVDYLDEEADKLNWDALGKYKIAEIDISPTGTEANILAYDYGYDGIENSKQKVLAPLRKVESREDLFYFLADVLPDYGFSIPPPEEVIALPKRLFSLENKLDTINELLAALYCFSRCDGNNISIGTFDDTKKGSLDNSNIISLTPEQSLVNQYDSSVVLWNEIGLKQGTEIASLDVEFGESGEVVYSDMTFDGYINRIEEIICVSTDGTSMVDVSVVDIYSNIITLALENNGAGTATVKIKAETLTFNTVSEGQTDNSENICEIKNTFIQTKEHAGLIKDKLDNFITTNNKYCGAEIRFNPLLQLGFLVDCVHENYDVDMEAYVVEQTLEVSDGSPAGRHSVKLLNKEAM